MIDLIIHIKNEFRRADALKMENDPIKMDREFFRQKTSDTFLADNYAVWWIALYCLIFLLGYDIPPLL